VFDEKCEWLKFNLLYLSIRSIFLLIFKECLVNMFLRRFSYLYEWTEAPVYQF